eukprot:scaffold34_cov62-Phaeocystis_antarctica.AAC.10
MFFRRDLHMQRLQTGCRLAVQTGAAEAPYGRIKVPTTWDAHTQEQPDDNRLIRAEQRSALPLYDSAGSAAAGGRGVALLARMADLAVIVGVGHEDHLIALRLRQSLVAARTRHVVSNLVRRDIAALVCVKEFERLLQLNLRGGKATNLSGQPAG